ncbi:MAG: hypothetical protein KAU23_00815, partial [Anaerolineales bacterium]|nr:hypothetical protein [Anaerolineales bacterium]
MRRKALFLFIPLLFLLYGCASSAESPTLPHPQDPATPTVKIEHPIDPPSTATPDLSSIPYSIWIDPHFPAAVHDFFTNSSDFSVLHDQQDTTNSISAKSGIPFGTWTYLLVSPFPSLIEGLDYSDLLTFWQTGISSSISVLELALTEETKDALTLLWGEPDPGVLKVLEANLILSTLWPKSYSIAIIPFEQLNPYWKVLSLDGQNPLRHDFIPDQYNLTLPIYISSSSSPFKTLPPGDLITNFDPAKLTTIALT